MDNHGFFNRKKISNSRIAWEKLGIDSAGYGEKDTVSGKLLKTIVMQQE
jgi:hypothetical protein